MRNVADLRAYQQRIVTHLYEHNEALCVAKMGGGKTIAALTAFMELKRDGVVRKAIVIAPKRVAQSVWPYEMLGWHHTCSTLGCVSLVGSPKQRRRLLSQCADTGDIILIGLDLVEWLLDELAKFDDDHPLFDLLIIDEISKLRDPTGVRATLLAKQAQRWRLVWGLSGTLRPNGAQDLFMPARIVSRSKLWGKSFYKWRQERFYPTDYHGYVWAPLPGEEAKINAEIAPLIVALRDDEMPQLPELSVIVDRVELPPTARSQYRHMHHRLMAQVKDKDVVAANAAVATGKLAQLANGFIYDESTATLAVHDEKRQWLADLVEQAEGPMILVYEYRQDLEMIREVVGNPLLAHLGAEVSDRLARMFIDEWNAGQHRFLALHPAAGGHGLNLQAGGADMAWISPTWSPELWEQTIARIHRPGQTRPVMVRVCVAHDTVDQMKLDRVHHKMDAQAAFERYLEMTQA